MTKPLTIQDKPRLFVVGFGAFGQIMAKALTPHFTLVAHDPDPGARAAMARLGVASAPLETVAQCPYVVIAAPVAAIAGVAAALAPHLVPGTLVLDVGSVKIGPARELAAALPAHVDILATHPLFGPQSAASGLAGLKIALCPLRGVRTPKVAAFLRRALKLEVIVTTPEAHDRDLAAVQGLTHLVARALAGMVPETRLTTRSFDLMMEALAMVAGDAPEVYAAIEEANPFAAPLRARFLARLAELAEAAEPQAPALWAQSM